MKPDGPLTKAGMRRAADLLKRMAEPTVDFIGYGMNVRIVKVLPPGADDMLRLARQLYAKAREPKP